MLSELAFVILGGVKFGAIYALAALGIVVIYKATKIVNFAHGAFVMIGAYGAYMMTVQYKLPYWAAYALVPPLVGIAAAGLELALLRPLRRADMFTVIVSTIFLGIALSELFRLAYNAELLAVRPTFRGPPLVFSGVILPRETIWVIVGALGVAGLGAVLFLHARLGRSMRAMAANPRGAQLCGYSVDRVFAMSWFFGGALAGVAGLFAAPAIGVSPDMAVSIITSAFVAAVIGGFDSLKGALVGGLILGLAETFAAAYVSSAAKNSISFLLLFVVLLWRPDGLFPEREARRV
jgi:branched-chain amino acid transport system permease protein